MTDHTLSQRHFTDAACRIVSLAASRASDRGLHFIGRDSYATILLWSLIRWERKVGLIVLETIGVNLHELADQLDVILTGIAEKYPVVFDPSTGRAQFEKTGEPYTGCDFDHVGEHLFVQAEVEGRALCRDYVGTEHLLLAVIRCADSDLKNILDKHLITYETVQATIRELFRC